MFHQANVGTYDGVHSLLGDLLDATFIKYADAFAVPVTNLTMRQAGVRVSQRMASNASGTSAQLIPCQSITVSVSAPADVPITGVVAGLTEVYGGQNQSTVHVDPGSPRTLPVTC